MRDYPDPNYEENILAEVGGIIHKNLSRHNVWEAYYKFHLDWDNAIVYLKMGISRDVPGDDSDIKLTKEEKDWLKTFFGSRSLVEKLVVEAYNSPRYDDQSDDYETGLAHLQITIRSVKVDFLNDRITFMKL